MPSEIKVPVGLAKIMPAVVEMAEQLPINAELTISDTTYADQGGPLVPLLRARKPEAGIRPQIFLIERPEDAELPAEAVERSGLGLAYRTHVTATTADFPQWKTDLFNEWFDPKPGAAPNPYEGRALRAPGG